MLSRPSDHAAVAIVLARAGSRGVPGKNTAPLAGRPCIAWTIEHALRSSSVRRVVVSTDSPAAAEASEQLGAQVVRRPPELASDTATVDAAARHACDAAGLDDDHARVVILYANVPVRPSDLTDRAVRLLDESGCDSVQSYQPSGKHHPWWTARLGDDGAVSPWQGQLLNHGVYRRQDLPPAFVPDGGVIALTLAALRLRVPGAPAGPHAFFGADRRGVINPPGSVVDIDEPIDLIVADAVLSGRTAAGPIQSPPPSHTHPRPAARQP
ncbi:MAG: acylneuraminate cytidylyltransferase [Planctomyces sp.]|nr:acylneuraminate cytidylyltransferase [Planctomyces sp.]MBA4119844.1 acylneuraminate cytidylyltransferase [Isosphaera sp.]